MTKQRDLLLSTIEQLARAVEIRDAYTGTHSQRVTLFAILLGEQLTPLDGVSLAVIGTGLWLAART